ncbi:MAG: hypothetical protein AAGE01_05950 [Pseudomonadota bacterium]
MRELRWIGWVEACGLLLAGGGWFADRPGVMMAGVAVMLVCMLAFVPLLGLARLEKRQQERKQDVGDDAPR